MKKTKEKEEEDEGVDITEKLKEASIGPIKMSDRLSGDGNRYDERIYSCSVQLNKLDPDLTRSVMNKQLGEEFIEEVEKEVKEDDPGPSNTVAAIKGEESEKNIMKIVESSDFDEFDITTQIDILDTSKKKIEEIRKSQEQVMAQMQKMEMDNEDKSKEKQSQAEPTKEDNQEPSSEQEEKEESQEESIDEKQEETNSVEKVEEAEVDEKMESEPVKTVSDVVVDEEKWSEGEKILCFHGPLIYEAKIQSVETQNGIPKYFIHYRGWNKNWDEWVPEARMMKFCDKNVEIQKDLCLAHEAKERAKKLKQRQEHVFAIPKNPSPVPRKEERGRRKAGAKPKRREESGPEDFCVKNGKHLSLTPPDNTVESEEQFKTKLEIKIKIPEELKSYIVDDWVQVIIASDWFTQIKYWC